MNAWHDHLALLDERTSGWTCRQRIEQVLAGEPVEHAVTMVARDVCDEGHVHTDVTVGLLTASRLVHAVAGDAHHVTDEHELGLQCTVASVPLTAISEVSVLCLDQDGHPATEVRVSRAGGAWQAVGDLHDCGDPHCEIPPGSIQLEAQSEGVVLVASGELAGPLAGFAGQLARVSAGT